MVAVGSRKNQTQNEAILYKFSNVAVSERVREEVETWGPRLGSPS